MPDCPFCHNNLKDCIVAENCLVVAIPNAYPVADGHLLMIPKKHAEDYFSMTEKEKKTPEI